MFIYKYIKVDNHKEISKSINTYIETKTAVLKEKLHWKFLDIESLIDNVPTIKSVFDLWNLQIIMAAAIYRNPYSRGGIHIDSSEFYRVLWPVCNCHGSYTRFFQEDQTKFYSSGGKDGDKNLSLISGQTLQFLEEFELVEPVIFNPKIPHGVYCNPSCDQPRISITFGFDKNPKDII